MKCTFFNVEIFYSFHLDTSQKNYGTICFTNIKSILISEKK